MTILQHIRNALLRREIHVRGEEREDRVLGQVARERREALIRGETEALPLDRFFAELEREHPVRG